MTVQESNHF